MTDIINHWNLDKNYTFSSAIYFRMDIVLEIASEDVLIEYFGTTWPRKTNTEAGRSAKRTCRSKIWHIRMDTKWWKNSHLTLLQIS